MERKKILITNDDGVESPGINKLVEELMNIADLTIVAPDRQKTATSHSLTIEGVLPIKEVPMPCGYKGFAVVNGTPTDCVLIAIKDIMKDELPDLLISGINLGANLGGDILYSGTVAAALEGLTQGITSFAVSLDSFSLNGHFETAAKAVAKIVETKEFYKNLLQERSILNINVPNIPYEELKGFIITRQGDLSYQNYVEKYTSPRNKTYYWIGGDRPPHEIDEETDSYALAYKKVSISPINVDLTNYRLLPRLKKLLSELKL